MDAEDAESEPEKPRPSRAGDDMKMADEAPPEGDFDEFRLIRPKLPSARTDIFFLVPDFQIWF